MDVTVKDREGVWFVGLGAYAGDGFGRSVSPPRDFGENGHDYELEAGCEPALDESAMKVIHSLMAERLTARLSRRFDEADAAKVSV